MTIQNNINKKTIETMISSFNPAVEVWRNEKTIMSIAGIAHLENIWSNIYAYFLDERESDLLSSVFIRSLERIISRKAGSEINLSKCRVLREVTTEKGNRIDLLISTSNHSVIIENKVHHHLSNDLDDYWQSVNGDDDAKTGIVLTLSYILTNNPHFINITHLEWMLEVEKELVKQQPQMTLTSSTLLHDFITTVKQISNKMNEQNARFYLENREQINNLYSEVKDYRDWLQKEVFANKDFILSLRNYTLVHNDWVGSKHRFAMYQIDAEGTNELVITVFYERLWNSKPEEAMICLYIQLLGDWLDKAVNNETEIRAMVNAAGFLSMPIMKYFWHSAAVEIPVSEDQLCSEEQLKNLVVPYLTDNSEFIKLAHEILNLVRKN